MNSVLFLVMRRMRRPLIMLICAYAVAIGGLVLIPGEDDQGQLWHFDFFHAFYFISFVGPTIGLGEIPYALVPAQRFWVSFSLYLTVISWLYAIGKIFSLVGEPAFVRALSETRFRRSVHSLSEPFHLICGYGETGSLLVEALCARGWRCVVIDSSSQRLDDLELAELPVDIPRLCANAGDTRVLIEAGLKHRYCHSVIAVTNSDAVNTKIAVTCKLLQPERMVLCRADSAAAMENMASFNTDHIVNPHTIFAEQMALAIRKPHVNELHRWLGARAGKPLKPPLLPPTGRWIICGYGRLGQAVRRYLDANDIDVTVIERDASHFSDNNSAIQHRIIGSATDPEPLHEAGVESCQGILAGTDSDADNLSIVLTARDINPDIYAVARQNHFRERELFAAAKLPLVVDLNRILAWRMLPLATVPSLDEFLACCRSQEDDWARELMDNLRALTGDTSPEVVHVPLWGQGSQGLCQALARRTVRLRDLGGHIDGETIPVIGLMLKRAEERSLLPDPETELQPGQQLLLATVAHSAHRLEWLIKHSNHWGSAPRSHALAAVSP
nr:potassium channel protein [Oceanococcus sp. HetDA_MAG_MS8]